MRLLLTECLATGSFNEWREAVPLHRSRDKTDWFVSLTAGAGLHQVTSHLVSPGCLTCHVKTQNCMRHLRSINTWWTTIGEPLHVRQLLQMVR